METLPEERVGGFDEAGARVESFEARGARRRPALAFLVALAAIAIAGAAAAVSAEVALLVALYGAMTVAYSLILKRLVILDVMTIASLFLVRVVAGAVAVEAHASEWLLLCTGMLALFLGFTKRRQEAMTEMAGSGTARPVLQHY